VREEIGRNFGDELDLEKAKWEAISKVEQHKIEEEALMQMRELERRYEFELESLRTENRSLSSDVGEKEEKLRLAHRDLDALRDNIENLRQEAMRHANEREAMKQCLEKEVHRAHKELKLKEESYTDLLEEIRALKETIAQQEVQGRDSGCPYCTDPKRRKIEGEGQGESQRQKRTNDERSRTQTASLRRTPSALLKQPSREKIPTLGGEARRAPAGRSVGTPRPASSQASRTTAPERERISSAIPTNSASPSRRTSVAFTPRKAATKEKEPTTRSSMPTTPKRELPSSAFASQTPRFDTKLDPLRYEKLSQARVVPAEGEN